MKFRKIMLPLLTVALIGTAGMSTYAAGVSAGACSSKEDGEDCAAEEVLEECMDEQEEVGEECMDEQEEDEMAEEYMHIGKASYAGWQTPEGAALEPVIFGRITTQTDKVRVYVYGNTTLKITGDAGIIFQKTYKREGKKTVKLPLQKAHT